MHLNCPASQSSHFHNTHPVGGGKVCVFGWQVGPKNTWIVGVDAEWVPALHMQRKKKQEGGVGLKILTWCSEIASCYLQYLFLCACASPAWKPGPSIFRIATAYITQNIAGIKRLVISFLSWICGALNTKKSSRTRQFLPSHIDAIDADMYTIQYPLVTRLQYMWSTATHDRYHAQYRTSFCRKM